MGGGSGSSYVFVRSGETWTHQAKLLAPDGVKLDKFGFRTAVYKDAIVVGIPEMTTMEISEIRVVQPTLQGVGLRMECSLSLCGQELDCQLDESCT